MVVACGAAAGISATFNAPLTGLFFGFEIVLKEFSLDALAATSLAAVTADLISRAFFGGAPFFAALPHDLTVHNDLTYLLIALLGITAGLIGVALSEGPLPRRRRRRCPVARAAGVAAPGRRGAAAGARAAGAAADVRGRLPGHGSGAGKPLPAVVRDPAPRRQDPRGQPDHVDRRIGRGVRPVAVHRRLGRDGIRHRRASPVRRRRSGRRCCTASSRWEACSRPPRKRR